MARPVVTFATRLCASSDLAETGVAWRFEVLTERGTESAFAVRFKGAVFGYLNRCMHLPMEMDWQPGQFFDDTGLWLVCATHGATYRPDTGACVAGPCRGARLIALSLTETSEGIFWHPDPTNAIRPIQFDEP
jgi:nitrite reductase/ring-hydroxylating ferredoxin subunit